jgi:hypothetical protein
LPVQGSGVTRSPTHRRGGGIGGVLLLIAALAVAVFLLAPNALAAGVGRVLAEVLGSALGAITALIGSVLGG